MAERALMRFSSSAARCDGRIVRRGDVGRASDEGGIGDMGEPGEEALRADWGETERARAGEPGERSVFALPVMLGGRERAQEERGPCVSGRTFVLALEPRTLSFAVTLLKRSSNYAAVAPYNFGAPPLAAKYHPSVWGVGLGCRALIRNAR